ncbi:MAG TPA: ribosomal-protein-alanine acetyltransferase, partial [Pseudomonadales bacterium]|nr:ribosomal-protein-alanine acetyltransferase [Pseudomonadales bacterium]
MIRPARLSDLTALLAIENRCFQTDRLSRRNFRYLLTQAKAATLLLAADGAVQGYVMLLFN